MEENKPKKTNGTSLAAKLAALMEACDYVRKNGTNDFHHYKYATSADVLAKVNAAMVQNRLCSVATPELLSFADVTNAKGNNEHLATVKMTVTIIDADNPASSITLTGIGSGQDAGDKAVMKAQTAALKYAYMLSFNIATGDDPEADSTTDEGSGEERPAKTAPSAAAKPGAAKPYYVDPTVCQMCGKPITEKVLSFSMSKYHEALCMDCQKTVSHAA